MFSILSLMLWPGPVLAATSTLSGSGLQSTTAGSLQTVDVQPMDVFGNPTSGVVDEHGVAVVFQLDIAGPAHLAAPFTLLPGRHEANYTLTRVGTYTIAVTSSATNVVGSPYQITIFPGDPLRGQLGRALFEPQMKKGNHSGACCLSFLMCRLLLFLANVLSCISDPWW